MKPQIINPVCGQYKHKPNKILCLYLPPPFCPLFTNTYINTSFFTEVNGKITCLPIVNANLLSINIRTRYLVKVISSALSVHLT